MELMITFVLIHNQTETTMKPLNETVVNSPTR